MEINIEKVAFMARIHLSDEEKEQFSKDLKEILKSFEIIKEVNVENVPPTFTPLDVANRYRDDEVREGLNSTAVMKDIKNKEDSYYKGPKVFEE